MLFESYPWKMELNRHLRLFKTWSKRSHTQRGGFYIERGVFLSAFIVRKLMENRKLTDVVRSRSVRCNSYRPFRPLSDRVLKFNGIFDPNKEYDLSKPETIKIGAYDMMSEIMHSYVFIPVIDETEGAWTSFLVNSYNRRDERLLEVERVDFERILNDVINDDVGYIHVWKHPVSGKVFAEVRSQSPVSAGAMRRRPRRQA